MVRNSQDDRQMSISTQPGEVDAKFARDAWLRALAKTPRAVDYDRDGNEGDDRNARPAIRHAGKHG